MNQRIALTSGANTGIGRIIALALAGRGYQLILAGRSLERTMRVLDEIGRPGKSELLFSEQQLDDLKSVNDCASAVLHTSLPTDLLLNNASLTLQRGQSRQGYAESSPSSYCKTVSICQIAHPATTTSLASNVVIPEYLWGFSEAVCA